MVGDAPAPSPRSGPSNPGKEKAPTRRGQSFPRKCRHREERMPRVHMFFFLEGFRFRNFLADALSVSFSLSGFGCSSLS
jgi:hypothetical protein